MRTDLKNSIKNGCRKWQKVKPSGALDSPNRNLAQIPRECKRRRKKKAQLINYHLGRLLDANTAKPAQISLAKLNNVSEALKIAQMARDILGARGILADHHVIRHLCDLEALSTLEGTAGMHTLILGQEITGISAFT